MARRKKIDDLAIPAFLRRPIDRTRTDSILRQETVRDWVMPDLSKYALTAKAVDLYDEPSTQETDMAKKKSAKAPKANGADRLEVECADPGLPVEVNFHQDDGKTEVKPFANMNDFMSWFSPSLHVLDGSIADDSTTMVEVTEKPRPKADKKVGKKGQDNDPGGAIPQPEKTTSRGAVVKGPKGKASDGKPKPRGVGFVRHGVRVTPPKPGKPSDHSSLYQAFVALGLSIPAHTKFRAELKKSKGGTLPYEEKGKTYRFDLVELKK